MARWRSCQGGVQKGVRTWAWVEEAHELGIEARRRTRRKSDEEANMAGGWQEGGRAQAVYREADAPGLEARRRMGACGVQQGGENV